jgi:glycosyltransferase involved in cell wall biosynthesis
MAEYAIPPELVPGPRSPDPVPAHAAEHAEGVTVIGYLRAELGIGEAARLLAAALERAGVPVATRAYTRTLSRQSHGFQAADIEPGPYDVNLVCVNADQVPAICWDAGSEVFAGRTTVGVWFWELPTFPFRQHRAFESVDEVWVATRFVRDAIAPATDKPVVVVPLPVPARAPRVVDRRTLGLPEGFLFLFAFDFLSSFDRKNPLGLVDAFRRAFAPGEGPSLVVKSINGDRRVAELEALRAAAAGRPDVVLVDEYFDADATDALMAACDCYVSLHRSEGFGLTLAHAMSRGKPVIATGYSGNVDFMDGTNSLLVGYREARVPRGSF